MEITEEQLKTIYDYADGPDVVGIISVRFYMHEDNKSIVMEKKCINYSMEVGWGFYPIQYIIHKTKIAPFGNCTTEISTEPMEKEIQDEWKRRCVKKLQE